MPIAFNARIDPRRTEINSENFEKQRDNSLYALSIIKLQFKARSLLSICD